MAQGIKDLAKGRSDVFRLSPDDIHVRDGWNSRDFTQPDNIAHVQELAASIREVGVRKPLTVYVEAGKAYLTDGECRLRAIRQVIKDGAEIATVPVITEDRHSSEADRLFTQIVGNSGKNFSALEKADVYKRLIDFGWSETDIARKAGVSRQTVLDMLALRSAPAPIAAAVKSGDITPTLAVKTIRREKDAAAETITEAVQRAKASGKKRATARDVGSTATGKTFKQEMREIVGQMQSLPVPAGAVSATVVLPLTAWERLQELVG